MTNQKQITFAFKFFKTQQTKKKKRLRKEEKQAETRQQRENDKKTNKIFSSSMRKFSRFQKNQLQMQLQTKMSKQIIDDLNNSISNLQTISSIIQQIYSLYQQFQLSS